MTRKFPVGARLEDLLPYSSGRPFYTDADIDRIIGAAGGLPGGRSVFPDQHALQTTLARCLKKATREWAYWAAFQKYPNYRQQAKEFARIELAAKRLLAVLHATKNGEISRIPIPLRVGGFQIEAIREARGAIRLGSPFPAPIDRDSARTARALVRESVLGVGRIRRWAGTARQRAELMVAPHSKRAGKHGRTAPSHTADYALNILFLSLGCVWISVFKRRPTTSVGKRASPNGAKPGGKFLAFVQACLQPLSIELSDEAVRDRVRVLFQGKGKSRRKKS